VAALIIFDCRVIGKWFEMSPLPVLTRQKVLHLSADLNFHAVTAMQLVLAADMLSTLTAMSETLAQHEKVAGTDDVDIQVVEASAQDNEIECRRTVRHVVILLQNTMVLGHAFR
jgi:hypothetical protein